MQHWRKICSIGEKYAALAKHMQHLRKICSICENYVNYCVFFTCMLQKVKKKLKQNGSDHHQVPRLRTKSTRGDTEVKTGTGRRTSFEPGIETSLEPLKHSLFGE